jgi:hypothetical protein
MHIQSVPDWELVLVTLILMDVGAFVVRELEGTRNGKNYSEKKDRQGPVQKPQVDKWLSEVLNWVLSLKVNIVIF